MILINEGCYDSKGSIFIPIEEFLRSETAKNSNGIKPEQVGSGMSFFEYDE